MIRLNLVFVACLGCILASTSAVLAEGPGDDVPGRFDEYELVMLERPLLELLPGQPIKFPEGLVELWMRALDRKEPELQRLIIDTMAMAFAENLQGLDVATERLVTLVSQENQDLDVLRAAIQTLISLDARDQQDLCAKLALAKGATISEIAEPALAKWQSKVMEQAWIGRLQEQAASPSQMVLAMRGLAAVKSVGANEALESLVLNASALRQLRITAAQTLGTVSPETQIQLAAKLQSQASKQVIDALLALAVLEGNDSPDAVELLQSLVDHRNSAVQSQALAHLYRVDYRLVLPHVERLIGSRDANVRDWCAKALVDDRNSDDVTLLAGLLNDVNPNLRAFIARSLVDFCEAGELKPLVLSEVDKVLAGANWRGCEQACVVLGTLDYEPAAERMVELLGHPRGDVKVAAAWALTQLRVAEVLPDMLDHAESVYQGLSSGQLNARMPGVTFHLAHLFVAFGDQGYTTAESLLVKMIPKSYEYGEFPRPAAVWALGLFHKGESSCPLIPQLVDRLQDDQGMVPEIELVRIMSAVSLGRMDAKSAESAMAKYAVKTNMLGSATRWGIEQITGDPVPLPPHKTTTNTNNQWFLTPLTPEAE